MKNEREELI